MYNNYDYPLGTDNPNASWNQEENPEREIEVTVSVTLSKTIKVKVSDYDIIDSGKDEDGESFEDIDYSTCNLEKAVKEQIVLPQDAWKSLDYSLKNKSKIINDLKDWIVDDFEIIQE